MRPLRFLLLLLLAQSLFALPIPPKPTAWVTDNANILSESEEQALNEKLEAVKQRTGAEMLVMTFPSLEGEEVVDYTNRVVNQWEVKDDRALMLFVFVNDRKVWTQVGYGLEGEIPDAIAARIYREVLVPNFQRQAYYEGIDEALNQYVMRIDPNALQNIPQRAPRREPVRREPVEDGGFPFEAIIFMVIIFVFVILPMLTRRRSGCSGCIVPFFLGGGGGGITFGGGGGGGWNVGGSWGGGGSSFGGGGAGGGW